MKRTRSPEMEDKRNPCGSGSHEMDMDLDKLIENRQEEKRNAVKEKLQVKLQTIRDQCDSGGNDQLFPEGVFERLKNNGLWENVLKHITDLSDVTNVSCSSKTFQTILEGRRKLMLFPKVLDVFKVTADKARNKEVKQTCSRNLKTICLDSRKVSKAWKEIADFQLFDSQFLKDDWYLKSEIIEDLLDPRSNLCLFEDEESVDRVTTSLLTETMAEDSPPSISGCMIRNVRLRYFGEDPIPFYYKMMEFLEIHGRSVWFFQFDWCHSLNAAEQYEMLCEMLKSMPDLKGLSLRDYFYDVRPGPPGARTGGFARKLQQHPFPVLHSLEHFSLHSKLNDSLVLQILIKSINLRSVMFAEYQTLTPEHIEALIQLPLRRYVGLRPINMITFNSNPDRGHWPWPLSHLTIDLQGVPQSASDLIPAINRFSGTLQSLRLSEWGGIRMDTTSINVKLDLPNLTLLQMTFIGRGTLQFDDLLLLKSLEEFVVDCVEDENKDARIQMKRYLESGEMNQSNVWKYFPNLKRFEMLTETFYQPRMS